MMARSMGRGTAWPPDENVNRLRPTAAGRSLPRFLIHGTGRPASAPAGLGFERRHGRGGHRSPSHQVPGPPVTSASLSPHRAVATEPAADGHGQLSAAQIRPGVRKTRSDSRYGGFATPNSVTIAEISAFGVTSK